MRWAGITDNMAPVNANFKGTGRRGFCNQLFDSDYEPRLENPFSALGEHEVIGQEGGHAEDLATVSHKNDDVTEFFLLGGHSSIIGLENLFGIVWFKEPIVRLFAEEVHRSPGVVLLSAPRVFSPRVRVE